MKLKILFILGLFLCLGRVANSNECSRHCPKATAHCSRAAADKPSGAVKTSEAGEVSNYSPTPLIRLLYI